MRTLRAMRLVAVSVVKNEADIIEAFVRHTRAWTDHHLIFDHASTDGTREILQALQNEGLPLTLYTDHHLGNLQQARSNFLTRLAVGSFGADWVFPLDADEFIIGLGRQPLEDTLRQAGNSQPATIPLLDYCATAQDDLDEINPALRLRHCRPALSTTRKIFVPRLLAADSTVFAGKGSHALYRQDESLPGRALPPGWHLAHLAMRSPQHQALRVMLAELQKLSRGRATTGLDVHYRLGFQLLAEDPELFFATVTPSAVNLRLQPVGYAGGALRHTSSQTWSRVARAMLPYLEHLARSHGELLDAAGTTHGSVAPDDLRIFEIQPKEPVGDISSWRNDPFVGFVPEAFLPPFHWGYAPSTVIGIDAKSSGPGLLTAEMLTYSEKQVMEVVLNGSPVHRLEFSRTNQRERLILPMALRAGRNHLSFSYSCSLKSEHDPRSLAVIFLSLRTLELPTPPA